MIFRFLRCLTGKLDDGLRIADLRMQRTVGGPLDKICKIRRHAFGAVALPSLLCALLVLASPSILRAILAATTAVVVCGLLIVLMRISDARGSSVRVDLAFQAVVVILLSALIWWFGPDQYSSRGLYRHVLVPIAAALSFSLLCAAGLLERIFRRVRAETKYDVYLKETELFASRDPAPEVTFGTLVTALLTAPIRAPFALLTPTAIATLVASPVWVWPATLTTLLIFLFALFVAGLNERFAIMWALIQGVFFKAGSLFVSLIVIALAAARLFGISYVTTVLDTAAWWTIGLILAFFYILSWWYDYWSNRLVTDEILAMLCPTVKGKAQIPYPINAGQSRTTVPEDGRVLQIHGASRFIVIREREDKPLPYFQSLSIDGLITTLALSGAPGGKAVPTPVQVGSRAYNFHAIAALIFGGIIAVSAWMIHDGAQLPEATLHSSIGRVALSQFLRQDQRNNQRPLIVVAASGGGTRAALYTAALLEGIARMGRSSDIVLASGVSGGGASLAYFAANRPALITNDNHAWDLYFDTMRQPFIQDVLNRSSEWRIATKGRLGLLLRESFDRRWSLSPSRTRLEDIADMGLILNTTLAGRLDCPNSECAGKLLEDVEPRFRSSTKSTLAGGRLLLTNLQLPRDLSGKALEPGVEESLPVILSGPDITLQQAAALNANFPPVFPNAAIDVNDGKTTRYWVTDGGAADNRGMEMMLYALRLTLKDLKADQLPPIYVIVADASGLSDAYTQDRGISSVAGAGSHFASHLDSELVSSIRQLYPKNDDRFHFSYVMMPNRLRESGSFGTHWMLQRRINIRESREKHSREQTITGDEMITVLRALHTPGFHAKLSPGACKVLMWSQGDPEHSEGWLEVVSAFGGSDASPTCETP